MLFVGRASLTGKRIAAGHIEKKLQFPRTRHSRDRIAVRPVIIVAPTSRARAFCRASQLGSKRIAAGHIGKKIQFPRTRRSRDRIAERAVRGGSCEICALSSVVAQLPARVLFVGQASLARKRIAAGHIGKKLQFLRTRHSRDRIAERAIRGGGLGNLRPVIILAPTSRARAFCRASQLS